MSTFRALFGSMMPFMQSMAPNVAKRFTQVEAAMANESVNGEAGAGLVKVCATVQGKVTSVAIDKALLAPEKQQVIEDLTLSAVNDALSKATAAQSKYMDQLVQDIGKEMMKSDAFRNPFSALRKS